MLIASEWKDYEVLDTGDGEKLEALAGYYPAPPRPAGHLAQAAA